MSLPTQRFEANDFSGGITENFISGTPRTYLEADNLWVTRDKQLETRPGSVPLPGTLSQLPSGIARVNYLINFNNDEALYALSGKHFYYQNATPAWVELTGPTGQSLFSGNDTDSKVAYGEWRRHIFLVTDGPSSPQKVYRDSSNVMQLRNAGLPKPVFISGYSGSLLLSAAIQKVVDIATAFQSHFSDAGSGDFAHLVAHTAAATAMAGILAAPPTSEATVVSSTQILETYYDAHLLDAQNLSGGQVYHIGIALNYTTSSAGYMPVLNISRSSALAPTTTLATAVESLNDLGFKYAFHTWATITHQNAVTSFITGGTYSTRSSGYGAYATSAVISPIRNEASPYVNASTYGTLFAYINNIKNEYNSHLRRGGHSDSFEVHSVRDTSNLVIPSDAGTGSGLYLAIIIACHLEFFFWYHFRDARYNNNASILATDQAFYNVTCTVTAGSATLTSASSTVALDALIGYRVVNLVGDSPLTLWTMPASPGVCTSETTLVTAADVGAGTLTLDHNIAIPNGTYVLRLSYSNFHFGAHEPVGTVSPLAPITTPASYTARLSQLDYTLQDTSALLDELAIFWGLFKTHALYNWTATNPTTNTSLTVYTMAASIYASANYNVHGMATVSTSENFPLTPVVVNGAIDPTYYDTPPIPGTYLYTFVYRYDYTVGGISFTDLSTPSQEVSISATASIKADNPSTLALYPISLVNLPYFLNTSTDNWDLNNVYVDVYRTILNGSTFFKVGSVLNRITVFTDSVIDENLDAGDELYTTGGVVGNDQPPKARFFHILNNYGYYGYVTDITSGEVLKNRFMQSLQFDLDSVPATFYDDLDEDLTGISSFKNYPIVFCARSFYRMEGNLNELGQGIIVHEKVSDSVGAITHDGIVKTEDGVFFCAQNGFYWTDGYSFTRISTELDKTYLTLVSTEAQIDRINSGYDHSTRRVHWNFMSDPTGSECDVTYTLDLNWGVSEKSTFTTASGGLSYQPSAMVLYQDQLIRGDARGYLFKHDPQYLSDPRVDTSLPVASWTKQPLIYDFQTCATDFGSSQMKKWVTRVTLQGRAVSDLSLAINHKTDDNRGGFRPLTTIRDWRYCRWGDPAVSWDNTTPDPLWSYTGMIDTYRRFTAGTLRCEWKQLQLTNANVIICNSDTYGLAATSALSAGHLSVTFVSSVYLWPLNAALNYTLSFAVSTTDGDGNVTITYPYSYAITARTGTTLTIADPDSTAPASSTGLSWTINGIPLDEKLNLMGYNMLFGVLSDEQKAYHGATSGDGGGNA